MKFKDLIKDLLNDFTGHSISINSKDMIVPTMQVVAEGVRQSKDMDAHLLIKVKEFDYTIHDEISSMLISKEPTMENIINYLYDETQYRLDLLDMSASKTIEDAKWKYPYLKRIIAILDITDLDSELVKKIDYLINLQRVTGIRFLLLGDSSKIERCCNLDFIVNDGRLVTNYCKDYKVYKLPSIEYLAKMNDDCEIPFTQEVSNIRLLNKYLGKLIEEYEESEYIQRININSGKPFTKEELEEII